MEYKNHVIAQKKTNIGLKEGTPLREVLHFIYSMLYMLLGRN